MSQKGKKWLRSKTAIFTINPKFEGGFAGSLGGLRYIKRKRDPATGNPTGEYYKTDEGLEWAKKKS